MPKTISGGRNSTCKFSKDLFKVYKIIHHYPAFLILTSNITWTNCFNRCHFGIEFFYFILPSFFYISHKQKNIFVAVLPPKIASLSLHV